MALHDKLEYFTDVMKTLLGDLVQQYVAKNPKLMLRRYFTFTFYLFGIHLFYSYFTQNNLVHSKHTFYQYKSSLNHMHDFGIDIYYLYVWSHWDPDVVCSKIWIEIQINKLMYNFPNILYNLFCSFLTFCFPTKQVVIQKCNLVMLYCSFVNNIQ